MMILAAIAHHAASAAVQAAHAVHTALPVTPSPIPSPAPTATPTLVAVAEGTKLTDIVLAFATVVLVLVTGLLAKYTSRLFGATSLVAKQTGELASKTKDLADKTAELARDTVAGTKRADVHHRQSLAPMLVVQPGFTWTDQLIVFKVENIGPGPAAQCKMVVTEYGDSDISTASKLIAPIGTMEVGVDQVKCPLVKGSTGNGHSHPNLKFELRATDVFGQTVTTKWSATGEYENPQVKMLSKIGFELTDVVLPES